MSAGSMADEISGGAALAFRRSVFVGRRRKDQARSARVPGGTLMRRNTWAALAAVACLSTAAVQAGWPFSSDEGPRRGTDEWYAMHADDPVGERQVYKFGKLWPPKPRPTGPKQLFIHKYHTQKYWPYPYVTGDRAAVRGVWQSQVDNGWQMATTLYEYHFDPETNALNSAGERQLQWILQSAPADQRQLYVQSMNDSVANQLRVANVQMAATNLAGADAVGPVALRVTHAAGRPAEEVNWILEQQQALRVPPQIQYTAPTSKAK